MKRLSLSRDGSRLLLVIPDQLPLRAAARAVRGCRYEGTSIDLATFSYPAAPDVCAAVMDTFDPQVANEAGPAVVDLMAQKDALNGAVAGKDQDQELLLDPLLRTTPMQHQVRALNFCVARTQAGAPGSALLMEQGCVDADTEYLTPTGWRRMDDWTGGYVMQYDPKTGEGSFVRPSAHVDRPCTEMVRFQAQRGSDQLLSPDHRMLLRNRHGAVSVRAARDVEALSPDLRRHLSVPLAFQYEGGPGVPLSEAALRLQVAVMADGYFPPNATTRCVVRLKRARKVARLHQLLEAAGVSYKARIQPATPDFTVFSFPAPRREKSYSAWWWDASRKQLDIIAEECLHWDGSSASRRHAFYTRDRLSADFIQYAFVSSGKRATLNSHKREYGLDYVVTAATIRPSRGLLPRETTRERPRGGRMYCFEVPTGFLVLRRNGRVFCTGNTGKSLVAIGMANWLHSLGHISWALVVCPNSLKGTWAADDGEVLKHSLPGVRVRTLRGSRDKRQDYLRRLVQPSTSTDLLWVVTNYDEFAVNIQKHGRDAERFQGTLDIVRAARPGILIADESTAVKNPNARRTRAVLKLAALFPYRMILTGTPVECSPLDLWSQFEVLQRGCLGFNSALAFEKSYAVHQRISVPKASGGRRSVVTVTSYKNLTDLEHRVAQVSFRVRAKDCLDLPPVTVRTLPVDLSAQQGRLLRELKSDMMAELGTALIDGRNILTRYQKMAQVVSGWVKVLDQDGVTTRWEALSPNPKLAALEEYLELAMEDPARKVVVFAEHPTTEIAAIEALCKRHGWGPVSFYGDVKEVERDRRRQLFTKVPDCRVFIAQYECGSKGLNLTAADTVVFYGLTFKYGTWAQARKRVDRKGQERPVTEVYLIGMAPPAKGTRMKRTLDHIQLEALRNKQNLADVVTGDHARRILEEL